VTPSGAPPPPPTVHPSAAPPAAAPRLLSVFDVLCLGVNAIVGSGIYAFPGLLAAWLGPASPIAFALCGVLCISIGLCFAEAAGIFERSGGPTLYAHAAFGPSVGYLVGWTCWGAAVLSWAAVAAAIPPYLARFAPVLGTLGLALPASVGITILLGAINFLGVKPGAYTTDFLTVAKLLPLLGLVAVGLPSTSASKFAGLSWENLRALPRATFRVLFAYQGFEVVPVPAGETRDPRRTAPLAVLVSLGGSAALYAAVQTVAYGSPSPIAGSGEALSIVARGLLGRTGDLVVSLGALVSMVGFCAGVALAGPRYLLALAEEGQLPRGLARIHPRFSTPYVSIFFTTAAAAILLLLLDFTSLVDLSVLTVLAQYLATCLAVPVLRYRRPDLERRFRIPGGALPVPLVSLAVLVFLALQAGRSELVAFSLLVLVGLPLRLGTFLLDRRSR
jgi:basic amino acid/polyamine antiporter, APA family